MCWSLLDAWTAWLAASPHPASNARSCHKAHAQRLQAVQDARAAMGGTGVMPRGPAVGFNLANSPHSAPWCASPRGADLRPSAIGIYPHVSDATGNCSPVAILVSNVLYSVVWHPLARGT